MYKDDSRNGSVQIIKEKSCEFEIKRKIFEFFVSIV